MESLDKGLHRERCVAHQAVGFRIGQLSINTQREGFDVCEYVGGELNFAIQLE